MTWILSANRENRANDACHLCTFLSGSYVTSRFKTAATTVSGAYFLVPQRLNYSVTFFFVLFQTIWRKRVDRNVKERGINEWKKCIWRRNSTMEGRLQLRQVPLQFFNFAIHTIYLYTDIYLFCNVIHIDIRICILIIKLIYINWESDLNELI